MKFPWSAIVRLRVPVLIAVVLTTVYFGWQMRNLKVDTDVLNYLPDSDPLVRKFKESGNLFGSNYIVMVALEATNLFAPEPLEALREVTHGIEMVKGVAGAMSLTNVLDMQKVANGIAAKPLLPDGPVPRDAAWLTALRKNVLANPIYRGNLVSPDGKVALITVRLEEKANKEMAARAIKVAAKKATGGFTLYFGGFSMIMGYMNDLIMSDMSRLAPAVVLLVALALFAGFGNLRAVLLPMGAVFLATAWTLGAMAKLHMPLNMMTSAAPVVLVAMGAAYGIYVLARFEDGIAGATASPADSATRALQETGWPIALTAATTAIGFISLLSASLKIFGEFGQMMAMGTFFAALLSLTFVPATLACLRPRATTRPRFAEILIGKPLDAAQYLLRNHAGTILFVTGLIAAASVALIPHIKRNVNLLSYFPRNSEPDVSERLMREKFGGSQLFLAEFSAASVKHPAVLHAMYDLQRELRVLPDVNYPQSAADVFQLANSMINERPGLPDTTAGADSLWVLLQGQAGLDQMIDSPTRNAVVMARVDSADNGVLGTVMAQVQRLLDNVPAEIAYVEPARFKDETRRALDRENAKRIARDVLLTLQFHGDKDLPAPDDLAEKIDGVIERPIELTAEKRQIFAQRLAAYFQSEESDIKFDAPGAAIEAANAVANLPRFDQAQIKEALRKSVPAKTQADDPKGIDYAAPTIMSRLKDLGEEGRLAAAYGVVGQLTAHDFADPANRELTDDLRSDLASVNDAFVAVSARQFKKIADRNLEPAEKVELRTSLSGWPPLAVKFDKELIATMVQSILLSAAVIFALLALQLRSLFGGLMASTPIFINLVTTFGVMSALGVPLDNSTMMITSIAMGIGVGYTIQFIARLKLELRSGGGDLPLSLDNALRVAGRPILINSLAVGLGFLTLVLSAMTPQKRFGSLIALTMFFSALAALTLLPAIFLRIQPAFLKPRTGKTE